MSDWNKLSGCGLPTEKERNPRINVASAEVAVAREIKLESLSLGQLVRGVGGVTFTERAISIYFILLPLLWMTGLLFPCGLVLIFGLFVSVIPTKRAFSHALPWFVVGISQIISVITNLLSTGGSIGMLMKHCLSSYVLGWFLLGSAIAVGASGQIRPEVLLRSIVRLSQYMLILCIPAYILALYVPRDSLFILTPIGHFIPDTFASRDFSFGMFVYNWEDFGGQAFPRLSLLFPWPTAMGAAGVCMVFIAATATKTFQRISGVSGGVVMVIVSMGRLAFLSLLLCIGIHVFIKVRKRTQLWTASSIALSLLGLVTIMGPQTSYMITQIQKEVEGAREGASEVRNEVYKANWAGFREFPLLGNGWPGEPLFEERVFGFDGGMVVGSHSTGSGLLYKGGAITFCCFLLASLVTFVRLLVKPTSPIRNSALVLIAAVACTCVGEGLESLVFSMLFVFIWIGVASKSNELTSWRPIEA